jgi:hypothetical protein
MSNILQGLKFDTKAVNVLKNDSKELEDILELQKAALSIRRIIDKKDSIEDIINAQLKYRSNKLRKNYWENKERFPSTLKGYYSIDGIKEDAYTLLDKLPKIKLSDARDLAEKFNMVIIPIEYTEIDKLFVLEENKDDLKKGLEMFKTALKNDFTTEYDMYILCPIPYYSVWEQVKSDKIRDIFYPEYFDTMFETLELLIPSQKNLYLANKINNENIQSINENFNQNMQMINKRINKMSSKINSLENEMIKRFQEQEKKMEEIKNKAKEEQENLKNTIIKQQQEIQSLYERLDPICFAVKNGTNITNSDANAIVGLCWGADIDDMIFDMKGITITNKDLNKINPLNILLKYKITDIDNGLDNTVKNKLSEAISYIFKAIEDNRNRDGKYSSESELKNGNKIYCTLKDNSIIKIEFLVKEGSGWDSEYVVKYSQEVNDINNFNENYSEYIRRNLVEILLKSQLKFAKLLNLQSDF